MSGLLDICTLPRCLVVPLLVFCLVGLSLHSRADVSAWAGTIEVEVDGTAQFFTPLQSHYDVNVAGDVVNVRLNQTFVNPLQAPVNARYLFPLRRNAAVHAMTMQVGAELIEAVMQEKTVAQATFEQAKSEGKAASLLEQHRPNMFTQRIANLMPGSEISVTIEYAHPLDLVDGEYELVIPMVVGPRFQPPPDTLSAMVPSAADTITASLHQAPPAYPPVAGIHVPVEQAGDRVSMNLALEAPLPVIHIGSESHHLNIQHRSSNQVDLSFAHDQVRDNKDFVLRYGLAAEHTDAGLLSHWEIGEGGYFSLLIAPPAAPEAQTIVPREMVFLLDCSGSMAGLPMQASKAFMRTALKSLRPQDSFRIIRFSDSATAFSQAPLPATPDNIQRGLNYTAQLRGSGGTMMSEGIRQALAQPPVANQVRNVIFLTDGYIGNELEVLQLVETLRGDARLIAFGVGAGVNRYLLDELGRVGYGFTRYLDSTQEDETVQTVAENLAARLQTPVLTDIAIDWSALPVADVHPQRIPDLYVGDTLRLTGRFTQPASGEITISGRTGLRPLRLSQRVELSDSEQQPVLRRIWARTAVDSLMHMAVTPPARRAPEQDDQQIKAQVTQLGLRYDIMTRWTAFVAVSRQIVNADPAGNLDSEVALPQVAGVSAAAYPNTPSGFAVPEPSTFSLLGVLALVCGITRWLRQRTRRRSVISRPTCP